MNIKETIVVEGRDDESAVRAAADLNIICTHGFGIRPETLKLIETAYNSCGIIIFTDPDHAGNKIRERLTRLFPGALQAYLTREQALRGDDIGIENACPEDILRALEAAVTSGKNIGGSGDPGLVRSSGDFFTVTDMVNLGLCGFEDSAEKRSLLGASLGIGSANTKTFIRRLNFMGIERSRVEELLKSFSEGPESESRQLP